MAIKKEKINIKKILKIILGILLLIPFSILTLCGIILFLIENWLSFVYIFILIVLPTIGIILIGNAIKDEHKI
jgi:hypothetical protein